MPVINVSIPVELDLVKNIGETADGYGFIELKEKIDTIVTDETVEEILEKEKAAD